MAASKKSNKLMNIGMIVAALVLVAAIAMIAVGLSGPSDKPADPTSTEATATSSADTSAETEASESGASSEQDKASDNSSKSEGASKPATAKEKTEKIKENSKKADESAGKSSASSAETHEPGTNKAQNQNPNTKKKSASSSKSTASTSSESSSSSTKPQQQQPAHAVTLSITCETILKNKADLKSSKAEFVPKDGMILSPTTVAYEPGQTVFDVLKSVCRDRGIQLEFTSKKAYIEGIGNLYEFDCGKQSGWMYKVNGSFPNYGCSKYVLKDNDMIVWCYTCKGLGADVGATNV